MFRVALPCIAILNCVFCSPQPLSPCELDAKTCITSLAQEVYASSFDGSTELKIDPLFNKQIDAKLPTVVYTLTDTTSKGFKNCQIKDASISSDQTSVHIKLLCPQLEMFGHYVANTTVQTLSFQGDGGFTLIAEDYEVHLDLKIKAITRNGKKYIEIIDVHVEAYLKGELDLKLENLFNGNEKLSADMHRFIKENPVFVTQTVQQPVLKAYFEKLVEVINKGMENIPVDKFF